VSFTSILVAAVMAVTPPDGFVDVADALDGVVVDARYAGPENFLGVPVEGYKAQKAVLSAEAVSKLKLVQAELAAEGLGLKVFDAYRPQRAVDHFMRWIEDDTDVKAKQTYYPDLEKNELVPKGYIAEKSGHSRGSTIDLTIIYLESGEELDMGSPWDFFSPISHAFTDLVSEKARANRMILRNLMVKHDFEPYEAEWWHFTLKNEPYPNTYFNFEIE
jgi:D-alanyl-D-alanine dipeptidase